MNSQLLDSKLKNLIQVCRETQNYKKLALVSFTLTSNRVNEIGINLGVRPRSKESGEKLFEYMEVINEIFERNLQIPIFHNRIIEAVRDCEILFLKNKREIPLDYIKSMFSLYYELRKLEVPNLHKALNQEKLEGASRFGAFSFFSSGGRRKERNDSGLKPLILQKIREREIVLRKNLQRQLDEHNFETAIHLRSLKHSISNDKKGRITVHGALKDNIVYQKSIEGIFGYLILGVILLFISLGITILIELSIASMYSGDLSSWVLIFFMCGAVLIFFYIKQFRKRRD
jgi:hypothetical protein